jgi:predicted ester cyclase
VTGICKTLLFLSGLLAALPLLGQGPAADSPEANKEIVRRYLVMLSGGSLENLEKLVGPDFIDRTPGSGNTPGPAAIRDSQRRARELFDDIRYTVDDMVAERDRVVARYTVRAIRKGAGGNSKPVQVIGITFFRVSEGQIRDAWIVNDQIELFRQLGYTLRPPQEEAPKPASPPPGRR